LKADADWEVGRIVVKYGASVGAGAVVLSDVTIGRFAMVGAGAVVTRDVPDHGLVVGSPARLKGFVCCCGRKLVMEQKSADGIEMRCQVCDVTYSFPMERDQ
jgi:serine acetyltransferase